MSSQTKDYYAVLGVPADATPETIKKAFFSISLVAHPDKRPKSEFEQANKEFAVISEAYNVLKDRDSRSNYDFRRSQRMQQPTPARNRDTCNPRSGQDKNTWSSFEPYMQTSQSYGDFRTHARKRRQNAHTCRNPPRAKRKTESDSRDSLYPCRACGNVKY